MERPEACSARFTRGYEYYRIETTKRTTLHRYRAVHVVTIAWDEFLIFEAEASGGVDDASAVRKAVGRDVEYPDDRYAVAGEDVRRRHGG